MRMVAGLGLDACLVYFGMPLMNQLCESEIDQPAGIWTNKATLRIDKDPQRDTYLSLLERD